MRRIVQFLVLAAIAAVTIRGWTVATNARSIRVVGPSMAPTLLGEHDAWTCVDCGFPFATAVDESELSQRPAICPNCDCRQPAAAKAVRQPGELLWINVSASRRITPQRWDVIVFRAPESAQLDDAQRHCIKRVVGLPGETVELRGGDVWIGGVRVRKTLAEQHSMAIVVNDSRFQPKLTQAAPKHWQPAHVPSGWAASGDGIQFRAQSTHHAPRDASLTRSARSAIGRIDWLQYTHWRRSVAEPQRWERGAVTDNYACNRAESRVLNAVDDFLLVARIKATGTGTLYFRGQVADREYVVQLDPQRGSGRLLCNGEVVQGSEFGGGDETSVLLAETSAVEFSLVDNQVRLAIDGRLLVSHDCVEAAGPQTDSAGPSLAVGATGLTVDVTELRLYRDVYYIPPARSGAITLGPDEYYVLGDNSPLSADSRTGWPGPGLPSQYVLGSVGRTNPAREDCGSGACCLTLRSP